MNSSTKDGKGKIESQLDAFLRQKASGERLGDLIADTVEKDAESEVLSPELKERARAAASRGMFDGGVARARANLVGSLGAFSTALRRIREEARCSREQMAHRAGIEPRLWADLEEQRVSADSILIEELSSVVEAVQLRTPEVRATLRVQNVRLLPGGQASFRSEYLEGADSSATREDLMAAVSGDTVSMRGAMSEAEIDSLVERIAEVLDKRGRTDLL